METTESSENAQLANEAKYVFMHFKGRVSKEILQETVFLKVANLHKDNPLVQVNDLLFKGTHDHAVGTNLFYHCQKNTSVPETYPFEKSFPTRLQFLMAETKVINCEQMNLKAQKAVLPKGSRDIKFNLDWNYDELLKKFEEGTLDIKDMVLREDTEHSDTNRENSELLPQESIALREDIGHSDTNFLPQESMALQEETEHSSDTNREETDILPQELTPPETHEQDPTEKHTTDSKKCIQPVVNKSELFEWKEEVMQIDDIVLIDNGSTNTKATSITEDSEMKILDENSEVDRLQNEYEKLLKLAKKPMRTKKVEEFESVPCEENCRKKFQYKNIESKILEPPHFTIQNTELNLLEPTEENLHQFIDLHRCKIFGIIGSTGRFPRKLTSEEKKWVLQLENLDLLSLQARFIVIQAQIQKLESFIQNISPEVRASMDAYGNTPEETLATYRNLETALHRRINEIRNAELDKT